MSGHRDRWLLLHGTPLTPEVWDGVAAYLGEYGPIWRPDASPGAGSFTTPPAKSPGRLAMLLPGHNAVPESLLVWVTPGAGRQ